MTKSKIKKRKSIIKRLSTQYSRKTIKLLLRPVMMLSNSSKNMLTKTVDQKMHQKDQKDQKVVIHPTFYS